MDVTIYPFFWVDCHIHRLASGLLAARCSVDGAAGAHVTAFQGTRIRSGGLGALWVV